MTLDADAQVTQGAFHLEVGLEARAGRVTAVLGPNGAGKSTLLRAIAGLLPLDAGHIRLDDRVLDDPAAGRFVPPEERRVGVVFQDYLLFPHLDALDNVAFGVRGRSKADARRTAEEWLARVDLTERGTARPSELSGGEAQRVALARALATEPAALLLDEPLSALDAETRPTVRRDLLRHLAAFEGPTLLVTHDPVDALTLADDVAIVEHGRVTQAGALAEVTSRPRTPYVARLIGTNLFQGTASGHLVSIGDVTLTVAEPCEGPVLVTIHPAAVALHRNEPEGSPRNHWRARVEAVEGLGDRVHVRLAGNPPLISEVTPGAVADLLLQVDDEVWVAVKATEITTYER